MQERIVVTGASSGIGAATVRRFAARGWRTVAVARRRDRLEDLAAETGAHPIACDVTDAAQVAALAAEVRETGGATGLANIAGGALGTDAVEAATPQSNDEWQWMFDVNVLGLRTVTAAMLPILREAIARGDGIGGEGFEGSGGYMPTGAYDGVDQGHGWGTILNLTSTAGLGTYPGGGGYNAAKFAAHAVTEVLRLELAGEPIRVMEVAPGLVRTDEFSLKRLHGDAAAAASLYADVTPLTADDIARVISDAFAQPPHLNQDLIVVRPVAQSSTTHTHRGPLAPSDREDVG